MDASLPEPDSGASTPCQSPIIATLDLAERLKECRLEPGTKIIAYYSPDNLAEEHAILSQTDDAGAFMPSQAQDEQIENDVVYDEEAPDAARKPRPVKRREPVAEDEVVADDAPMDEETPAVVVPKTHKATHATVGVPAPEVDVKKIVEDSAGATPYTVMLAIVAVVGGGAGWKFYQNYARQKHDQAMKALEIEQARVDKQQNDHQACAAKNAALVAQIDGLNGKISALESKVSAIPDQQPDLGFSAQDFEKVEKRLKAVEKKIQQAKASTATKPE